ncbi:MAG: tol-pal system protein YbgF [Calditrichaeota bacterium]|nr:tol-pal system protein YbgF [Calditrichota bacterium]
MKTLNKGILFLVIGFLIASTSFAENQRKYGIGFDSGFQRIQGGSPTNYFSAVYGLYGVYNLGPKYSIHLRASYGKLESNNGGYYWSSLTPIEAFFSYKILRTPKFEPAVHFGVAAYRFTNATFAPKHYYDGAVFPGIDIQYYPFPNVSVLFSADFKLTTGKELDNAPTVRDGYAVIRGGLTYYWLKQSEKKRFRPKKKLPAPGTQVVSKNNQKTRVQNPQASAGNEEDVYLKVVELKSTIDNLEQKLKQKQAQIDELKVLLNIKKDKIAILDSKVKNLQTQVASGQPYSPEKNAQFTRSNTIPQRGKAVRASANIGFRQAYKEALKEFNSRRYKKAIQDFSLLIQTNPNHPLASNCHYWIGESYYALKNYQKAKSAFESVLSYQKTYKREPALLMLGLSYLRLGDKEQAKEQLSTLVRKYPHSVYAKKAKRLLKRIERASIS